MSPIYFLHASLSLSRLLQQWLTDIQTLYVYSLSSIFLLASMHWIQACRGITLEFDLSLPPAHIAEFLMQLTTMVHITSLGLNIQVPAIYWDAFTNLTATLVQSLPALEHFAFSNEMLSPGLLDVLRTCPCLTRLHVFSHLKNLIRREYPSFRGFFNLKQLDASDLSPFNIVQLLRAIGVSHLGLSIVMCELPYPQDIKDLCEQISTYCPTLRAFSLRIHEAHLGQTISLSDFFPLRPSHIKAFIVAHPYRLICSDADIQEVFRRWQGLEVLTLNPSPKVQATSSDGCPTMRTLHTFVKKSGLTKFGAYFGPRALVPRSLGTGASNTTLKVLDLGRTGGEDTGKEQSVKAYLHGLFPSVRLESNENSSSWVRGVVGNAAGSGFVSFSLS